MALQTMVTILVVFQMTVGLAASPAIGVVTAKGSFRIDDASIAGNGTVFDGSTVETLRVSSQLQLATGAKLDLGAGSRGRIYRDRLVLERGVGEIRNATQYGVEASNLRVIAYDVSAVGRVSIRETNRVQVAALMGGLRVVNGNGLLLAAIPAGRVLEFEPQAAGAAGPVQLAGCLNKRDGRYFLTDETTNVTVELRGSDLDRHVGHKVEVIGSQIPGAKPTGTASQLIQVGNLKELARKCSSTARAAAAGGAAAGAAGGTAAGGGAAAGAAVGVAAATKALIAGVIIAAAATGTAVGLTAGDDSPPPSISQ